jgi:hypothetical protein
VVAQAGKVMAISATHEHPQASVFADGLGDRVVTSDGATGELLQVLHLRPALTAVPSFEFALRERAARLANFRHASYARVRRIDRTPAMPGGLAVVSDHIEGTRLSELLRIAEQQRLTLDTSAAMYLIQQLVPAVALLHENARDAAHGCVAPERLVVTPQGRLVIVEHVLGAAIEQLQLGRDRLWQEFRIAMPATAGLPRFDHRADVAGIGLVALALMLGRPLARDEYPYHAVALLNETQGRFGGATQPLSPGLRGWIARALQLEIRRAFASASETAAALDEVLASEPQHVAAPVALETFLTHYTAALLDPASPATIPATDVAVRAAEIPSPVAVPTPVRTSPPVMPEPPVAVTPPVAMPVGLAPAPPIVSRPEPPAIAAPQDPAAPGFEAADLAALIDLSDLAPPPAPTPPESAIPTADRGNDVGSAGGTQTEDPALLFAPEDSKPLFDPDDPFTAPVPPPVAARPARAIPWRLVSAAAALLVVLGGGVLAATMFFGAGDATPALGTLVVESNPSGVPVFVDGVDRGVTPASITLAPGSHILELRRGGVPRVVPFTLAAGAQVTQYLEFAETPMFGHLIVRSEPAGARVLVGGVERGIAPVTLDDLSPGEHEVTLQTDAATSRHTVVVQAGSTASLVVPIAGAVAGPVSGWVTIKAPFRMEIYQQGRLLGTNEAERLMMTAGRHELELVNDALGYRVTRVVQVPPGRTATIDLEVPRGVVNLNAIPWAEVWIGGQKVGDTPIGNLSVPIGAHEVIFRHPQFGEKRHAISVTLGAPVRVSVDMKQ